jgi:DNA polymerase III alpha subunit
VNQIQNRTLWYDGSIVIDPNDIFQYLDIKNVFVTHLTDDIIKYNKHVVDTEQFKIKESLNTLDTSWNIPDKYKQLNIMEYIIDKLSNISNTLSDNDLLIRYDRIKQEFKLYEQLDLTIVLQTMVYVIDTFKKNNVIWGVGRGSSVSSYILYLLEVHDVDSVMYDLDFNEFLRVSDD